MSLINSAKKSAFEIHMEPGNDQYFHSYTNENYLYNVIPGLQAHQDISDKVLNYLASHTTALSGENPSFLSYFLKNNKVTYQDEELLTWKHKLRSSFAIRSEINLHANDECPGAGNNFIRFNTKIGTLKRGDVLFHYKYQNIQLSVESFPSSNAGNWTYDCLPISLKPGFFIPKELLDPNEKWVLGWSNYGEASKDAGSWMGRSAGWVEYGTTMATTAKEYEITDKALQKMIRVSNIENPLEYPDKVVPLLEMQFRHEYNMSLEKLITLGENGGRSIIDPSSGHYRRYNDGMWSWLRDGNVEPYPIETVDIDYFDQIFTSFWTDVKALNNRDMRCWAGIGAIKMWERINRQNFSKGNILATMEEFTKRSTSYDGKNYNGLQYPNAFFTKAAFFPGGSMELEHMPMLDSKELSGGITYKGLPISSYYMIFADYGAGDGFASNMEIVKKKNAQIDALVCGLLTPTGLINGSNNRGYTQGAHTGRTYKVILGDTLGFRVNDPSKILMMVPDVFA